MRQHELTPAPGSNRPRKRVGRGDGSGHGSYSGRGMKGQKSRSGAHTRPGFEGGQLPLVKRLPHLRGFHNLFRTEYAVVNVGRLEDFPANSQITPQDLYRTGVIRDLRQPIKVLGEGELTKTLQVAAHAFSASARQKIEAAGGQVEELPKR